MIMNGYNGVAIEKQKKAQSAGSVGVGGLKMALASTAATSLLGSSMKSSAGKYVLSGAASAKKAQSL